MTDDTTDDRPLADLTAEGDRDLDGLNPMQRRFVQEALDLMQEGEKHWRKKAAAAAGYKEPRGAAYDLIRHPLVVKAIQRRLTGAAQDVEVDRRFVLWKALTNMAACEGQGDFRTAKHYLDIIGKHVDVGALVGPNAKADNPAMAGMMQLPFDPKALSTEELANLVALLRKAAGGQPTE